jgi:DNA-binding NtrC family response regulator
MIMTDGDVIDEAHVDGAPAGEGTPAVVVRGGKVVGPAAGTLPPPADEIWSRLLATRTLQAFQDESERLFISAKIAENGGNVTRTAEAIETPRSNLYKKIERYGLRREEKSDP